MARGLVGILGAVVVASAMLAAPAAAQFVPLPTPAPLPKDRSAAAAPARPTAPPPVASAPRQQEQSEGGFPFLLPFGKSAPRSGSNFDANQRALTEKVNAYLTNVQTLVGKFTQVGPDGKRTTGNFYIQKPGKIRFEYDPPSPIELVSDGSSLVVRDRRLATQDLYPLSQTPLRFLLADRIDLLRDTNVVAVHADDVFVSVVIEEKHTFAGTNRLMLMFGAKDMQLKQWTITDPQGYDTTVAVYNIDPTKKPDPGMFRINYERMIQ